jgi:hypothetical protein
MTRYFIGGAAAAGAVSRLHLDAVTFSGTAAHAITGSAEDPFKFVGVAVRAFERHFLRRVHDQNLKAVITFQASKFI